MRPVYFFNDPPVGFDLAIVVHRTEHPGVPIVAVVKEEHHDRSALEVALIKAGADRVVFASDEDELLEALVHAGEIAGIIAARYNAQRSDLPSPARLEEVTGKRRGRPRGSKPVSRLSVEIHDGDPKVIVVNGKGQMDSGPVYRLLLYLVEHANKAVRFQDIADACWNKAVTTRTVSDTGTALRRWLRENAGGNNAAAALITVPGKGLKLMVRIPKRSASAA